MIIKVPATSANIGPGFDSIGIAVSLFLTIKVLGPSKTWNIRHSLGSTVPSDDTNLILSTALSIVPKLTPHHIEMITDIPMTRGLGSSSSAIVAGIELANQLGNLKLSNDEKLQFACTIEGHPDNVAPAILGNLVIGTNVNGRFSAVKANFPNFALVACIPSYELKTSESRNVLPRKLEFNIATHASSVSNTFVAALLTGDYKIMGQMIELDQFHEPFRQAMVPELKPIRKLGHRCGAIATYLSGAGPTVMTIIENKKVDNFISELKK
ncbi:homoserine kinase [Paucilactobacillus hokkaidonensis]|nr:homoserine kinase [Paucilactobacillus hokkaidonensis]